MGREVRRVIPQWEHPKEDVPDYRRGVMRERYRPMFDRDVQSAFEEWYKGYQEWISGAYTRTLEKYPDCDLSRDDPYRAYCEWSGTPPDPACYRPKWDEAEMTWYQLYETVSEGTPVSPPFETAEEVAQYLAVNGDFWYQGDIAEGRFDTFRGKPTLEQARSLMDVGWAMSMIATGVGTDNVQMLDAYGQQDLRDRAESNATPLAGDPSDSTPE